MSKDQKDHAIKIIFANEFRYEPDEIQYNHRPTIEEVILVGCLKTAAVILLLLIGLVSAAIFYA